MYTSSLSHHEVEGSAPACDSSKRRNHCSRTLQQLTNRLILVTSGTFCLLFVATKVDIFKETFREFQFMFLGNKTRYFRGFLGALIGAEGCADSTSQLLHWIY